MKGKTLAVQPGGHERQQQGRRADEWHDTDIFLLGQGDKVGARVGNGWTTGFRQQADIEACAQRGQ